MKLANPLWPNTRALVAGDSMVACGRRVSTALDGCSDLGDQLDEDDGLVFIAMLCILSCIRITHI